VGAYRRRDFSAYLLKIRDAKGHRRLRISPMPTSPTCNVTGIWPLVWDSQVKTASAQKFTDAFTKKYGKPPENQAWGDYMSTKTSRRR